MEFATFDELIAHLRELNRQKEYALALDLASQALRLFPDQQPMLYYWCITMAARIGDLRQALGAFQEAIDKDIWYGEILLRKSPSLKTMQGMDEFERLVELNFKLQEKERQKTYPLLILFAEGLCQAKSKPCPLLLGLHANGSSAQASIPFWRPAATLGWMVALPQSSQAMWKGVYIWDDRQITESEIKKHYDALRAQYAIDEQHIVIAGHGMGGETAIWLAIGATIPACGFIAFSPEGPLIEDIQMSQKFIEATAMHKLRGFVLVSEKDAILQQDNTKALVEVLKDSGIPCKLEIAPTSNDDLTSDMESYLRRALEFITGI